MKRDPLPTEFQRQALGQLLHDAFNYMRYANAQECNALAYALHNIPVEIYGWGEWNVRQTRGQLMRFQFENYKEENRGPDFVAIFNKIFPENSA